MEELYRQKLDAGSSARLILYIRMTIRKALDDAVRLKLLSLNDADSTIPSYRNL